jgi:hypothetical protein
MDDMHGDQPLRRDRPTHTTTRRLVFVASTPVLAVIAAFICCELGLRAIHLSRSLRQSGAVLEYTLDRELGWRATENYRFVGELVDAAGTRYFADVRTDAHGFRVFGDPAADGRPKLLVVGDSFTHAIQVSGSEAYYSRVGADLGVEVFAYGAGGYGTLQELLVIDELLDHVTPDVVVIQLCSNDFINNHFDLEMRSRSNNNGLLRPYRTPDGRLVYRVPKRPVALRKIAARYSRFLYFIFSRTDRISSGFEGQGVEDVIARRGLDEPDYAEAHEITARLLRDLRGALPRDATVFAFCVDATQPSYDHLRELAGNAQMRFIDGIPQAIRAEEIRGGCTRAADGGHWNENGHRIAAAVIARAVRQASDPPGEPARITIDPMAP